MKIKSTERERERRGVLFILSVSGVCVCVRTRRFRFLLLLLFLGREFNIVCTMLEIGRVYLSTGLLLLMLTMIFHLVAMGYPRWK